MMMIHTVAVTIFTLDAYQKLKLSAAPAAVKFDKDVQPTFGAAWMRPKVCRLGKIDPLSVRSSVDKASDWSVIASFKGDICSNNDGEINSLPLSK